jgi:lysophospholipid acyltransferase (LPLAT)-like uncharacterized protein
MRSARRSSPPQPETELSARPKYRWLGFWGALLLRLWGRTLRVDWDLPPAVRALEEKGRHLIYSFWHAHILTLAYTHRGRGAVVLISRHGDGEIIAQIIHRLGYGTVRGSTSRGGLKALLQMAQAGKQGHPLGVSPDGPRGPRHVLQPGLLVIAKRSGLPIIPLSAGARRERLLQSWDRFQLPHPFTRVRIVVGQPLYPPEDVALEDLERAWGPEVQEAMRRVEERAERWSRGLEEGS